MDIQLPVGLASYVVEHGLHMGAYIGNSFLLFKFNESMALEKINKLYKKENSMNVRMFWNLWFAKLELNPFLIFV